VAHLGAVVAHWRDKWWLIWEHWWLIFGSSGGSLVATPDCKPAVPGSNLAISPAYSGLSSLDGLPSGMVLHCRLSSEGRQRRINTLKKGPLLDQKTIKEKKN
jgi:hypothetical protein